MVSQNSYSFFLGFFDQQNIKKLFLAEFICFYYIEISHWTQISQFICAHGSYFPSFSKHRGLFLCETCVDTCLWLKPSN